MHNTIPIKHTNVIPTNIDHVPSRGTHLGSNAMLCVFEDDEAVTKMIIKGRRPTMRHVPRTHRVAVWQNQYESKDLNQVCRHHTPTRRDIDKGKFHRWWVEQSSPFVQHHPFQLNLLLSEFQLYQLPWNDSEKGARRERRRQDCGKVKADVEPGHACCDKFFDCAKSNCVEKSVGAQGTCQSDWKSTGRPVAREHNQDAASSSPEKNQELLNVHENLKGTRKLVASGNSDIDGTGKIWPHNPHFSDCLRSASWEGFLECETEIRSQPGR